MNESINHFNTLRQRAKKTKYRYKKILGNTNIEYKRPKLIKKPRTKNMTRKTIILVLKTVKSYNRTL